MKLYFLWMYNAAFAAFIWHRLLNECIFYFRWPHWNWCKLSRVYQSSTHFMTTNILVIDSFFLCYFTFVIFPGSFFQVSLIFLQLSPIYFWTFSEAGESTFLLLGMYRISNLPDVVCRIPYTGSWFWANGKIKDYNLQ